MVLLHVSGMVVGKAWLITSSGRVLWPGLKARLVNLMKAWFDVFTFRFGGLDHWIAWHIKGEDLVTSGFVALPEGCPGKPGHTLAE